MQAGEGMRVCPFCEKGMTTLVCPTDGVPTLPVTDTSAPTPASPGPGTVICDRYRIEHAIGEGGMGTVFAARQLSMDRTVALKVLKRDFLSNSTHVRRFYTEARSVSALDHPNIVRTFDFGIDAHSSVPFIAMELLQGSTLSALLRSQGPLPERRSANILAQVAKALVEAHEKQIVHRDLKPHNIMVRTLPDGDEHVKVLDFGIAKILRRDSARGLTETGTTLGTPTYMSPEQVAGKPIDFRADLYSLGCILHQMLSGRPPFEDEELLSLMLKQVGTPPPPLPPVLADGAEPTEAIRVLHGALLAKRRFERPCDTRVVGKILAAIAQGMAINANALLEIARAEAVASGRISLAPPPDDDPMRDMASALSLDGGGVTPTPTPTVSERLRSAETLTPPGRTPVDARVSSKSNPVLLSSGYSATHLRTTGEQPASKSKVVVGAGIALVVGIAVTASLLKSDPESADAKAPPVPVVEAPRVEPPPRDPKVEEPPAAPAPQAVKKRVESEPLGAEIFVDGAAAGRTPGLVELPAGKESVEIELKLHAHQIWRQRLNASDADPVRVRLVPVKPSAKKPITAPALAPR
jgi:eukaryotic-like serine/threonine-protein kinase